LLLVVSVSCPDCIVRSGVEVSIGLLDRNTLVWAGRAVALSLSNKLKLSGCCCLQMICSTLHIGVGVNRMGIRGFQFPSDGWVERMYCQWEVLWADNLRWEVGLGFLWIVVYLSDPTTRVVGPKALWTRFWCALFRFVVPVVIAYSLLFYHVNISRSTYLLRLFQATNRSIGLLLLVVVD
jgi:hypothetical protein